MEGHLTPLNSWRNLNFGSDLPTYLELSACMVILQGQLKNYKLRKLLGLVTIPMTDTDKSKLRLIILLDKLALAVAITLGITDRATFLTHADGIYATTLGRSHEFEALLFPENEATVLAANLQPFYDMLISFIKTFRREVPNPVCVENRYDLPTLEKFKCIIFQALDLPTEDVIFH